MYALMAIIFVIGYLCIALEHPLKIDKAASAILTAVICWTVLVLGADSILPVLAEGEAHGPISELRPLRKAKGSSLVVTVNSLESSFTWSA